MSEHKWVVMGMIGSCAPDYEWEACRCSNCGCERIEHSGAYGYAYAYRKADGVYIADGEPPCIGPHRR